MRLSLSASLNTPDSETWWVPLSLTMVASPMEDDTVGAWLSDTGSWASTTDTLKVSLTRLPSLSREVTVMVAVPLATPVRVSFEPSDATDTVALASWEDAAVMVSESPSASLNTPARDTSCVASTSRPLTSARAEVTTGAAFTVTVKLSETVPPLPSSAVTVMVAWPRAWAFTVRLA